MPWKNEYWSDKKIIYKKNWGEMTKEEFWEGTKDAWNLARKHDTLRALVDCSEMTASVSVVDIFSLPKHVLSFSIDMHKAKIAVVVPAPLFREEDWRFYETVSRNRGLDTRMFKDKERAMAWLTGKKDYTV